MVESSEKIPQGPEADGSRHLTDRELQVLRMAANGMSNREIAHALGITDGTVKRHFANAYPKLGVSSRGQAATRIGGVNFSISSSSSSSHHSLKDVTPHDEGWWGRYLQAEQKALRARRDGKLAAALGRWPEVDGDDSELDRLAEEDRRLAEEGLVELLDADGGRRYKRLDELTPEDVPARLKAEQAKIGLLQWRIGNRVGPDGAGRE